MRNTPLAVGIVVLLVHFVSAVSAQDTRTASDAQAPMGQWRIVGDMHERREYAGGVQLNDGRILAVSGHPLPGVGSLGSAELYNPQTETWTVTGSLRQPRNGGNTATLLADGRVLLAGGHSNSEVIRGAEIYDPATGQWSDAGNLSVARDPVPTFLADGRVLVAGGIDWFTDSGKAYDVAEIYDPKTGEWTVTGSLTTPRYAHQMILLDDGRVLAMGGYEKRDVLLTTAEIYDPQSGRWQETGSLSSPRVAFGLVKLRDGRVLVAGGFTGRTWNVRNYVSTVTLYDPALGTWREIAPMNDARAGFPMIVLPNGLVLAAGGWGDRPQELKAVEIFDPNTETWRAVAPMNVSRRNHRAALLSDGSVLIMGGSNLMGGRYLASCEIFSFERPGRR